MFERNLFGRIGRTGLQSSAADPFLEEMADEPAAFAVPESRPRSELTSDPEHLVRLIQGELRQHIVEGPGIVVQPTRNVVLESSDRAKEGVFLHLPPLVATRESTLRDELFGYLCDINGEIQGEILVCEVIWIEKRHFDKFVKPLIDAFVSERQNNGQPPVVKENRWRKKVKEATKVVETTVAQSSARIFHWSVGLVLRDVYGSRRQK